MRQASSFWSPQPTHYLRLEPLWLLHGLILLISLLSLQPELTPLLRVPSLVRQQLRTFIRVRTSLRAPFRLLASLLVRLASRSLLVTRDFCPLPP